MAELADRVFTDIIEKNSQLEEQRGDQEMRDRMNELTQQDCIARLRGEVDN